MSTGTQHEQRQTRRRDLNRVAPLLAMLFATAAMLVRASVMTAGTGVGAPRSGAAWVCVIAALFAVCALACNRMAFDAADRKDAGGAVWTLTAGACCAMSAGVQLAGLMGGTRPWLSAVFCAGGMLVADMACVFPRAVDPTLRAVASSYATASLLLAMACAGVILYDLPASTLAGAVIGTSICAVQLMPNLVVHVPDRYLVEWRTYMTRRWTVRGAIPDKARMLTPADVKDDMAAFLARYAAGLGLSVTLAVLAYAALADWMDYGMLFDRIGFNALSLMLFLFLTLKPRQSGRPFERYLMRGAGMTVPGIWAMHATRALPEAGALLPLMLMLAFAILGMLLGYGMLAQHNGFHSLALSRIGDMLCFASTMLIPVAVFFAAGTLELLRGMPW